MLCTMRDLEAKDIVNVCTGAKLGRMCDLEMDTSCGKITAILVADGLGGFWQSRTESLRIPWENVRCVGEDAILVEVQRELPEGTHRRRRFFWG